MKHAFSRLGACLGVAVLAACATPPSDQFYTLSGGAAASPAPAAGKLYVEMLAVTIPAQVRRNQLVVGSGEGRVDLLEHHRWIGPLGDEIGNALSQGVTSTLGAIDVYRTPHPADAPLYRVSTNIQRFESVPGSYALVDAVWSVRQVGSETVLTCRSVLREQVGEGYDALVAGHRAALARLSAAIAAGVRDSAAGRAGTC